MGAVEAPTDCTSVLSTEEGEKGHLRSMEDKKEPYLGVEGVEELDQCCFLQGVQCLEQGFLTMDGRSWHLSEYCYRNCWESLHFLEQKVVACRTTQTFSGSPGGSRCTT